MSFDVDEKEFYDTFDELVADPQFGMEGAQKWAWSALEYAQQEKNKAVAEVLRLQGEPRSYILAVEFLGTLLRAWRYVKYIPKRLKYRYFPIHRIKRKTFPNGTTINTVPLTPGMVPEEVIHTRDTAPNQTRPLKTKRPFSIIIESLIMVPRNHKKKTVIKKEGS